jgi:hypothetical protein
MYETFKHVLTLGSFMPELNMVGKEAFDNKFSNSPGLEKMMKDYLNTMLKIADNSFRLSITSVNDNMPQVFQETAATNLNIKHPQEYVNVDLKDNTDGKIFDFLLTGAMYRFMLKRAFVLQVWDQSRIEPFFADERVEMSDDLIQGIANYNSSIILSDYDIMTMPHIINMRCDPLAIAHKKEGKISLCSHEKHIDITVETLRQNIITHAIKPYDGYISKVPIIYKLESYFSRLGSALRSECDKSRTDMLSRLNAKYCK